MARNSGELLQGLSLGQGAAIVALISALVTWASSQLVASRVARWILAAVIPAGLAWLLYWAPVWLGASPSEYAVWTFIFVVPWFIAGALASCAVLVAVAQRRPK